MTTDKTGNKQRGRPFTKGQSGNPKGRPKGARNKTTLAAQMLLEGEAEALTRKVIDMALEGDMIAIKLCMERILPPAKDRPITFNIPEVKGMKDADGAFHALLATLAKGEIIPLEAHNVTKFIQNWILCSKELGEFKESVNLLKLFQN